MASALIVIATRRRVPSLRGRTVVALLSHCFCLAAQCPRKHHACPLHASSCVAVQHGSTTYHTQQGARIMQVPRPSQSGRSQHPGPSATLTRRPSSPWTLRRGHLPGPCQGGRLRCASTHCTCRSCHAAPPKTPERGTCAPTPQRARHRGGRAAARSRRAVQRGALAAAWSGPKTAVAA